MMKIWQVEAFSASGEKLATDSLATTHGPGWAANKLYGRMRDPEQVATLSIQCVGEVTTLDWKSKAAGGGQ